MGRAADIADNLVTTLKAINGSPTYNNTMRSNQVTGAARAVTDIPVDAFPHFAIVYKGETREKEPGQYKKSIDYDIMAIFLNPKQATVEDWLEDIEKAISTDHTRGGAAYETWVPEVDRDSEALDDIQIYRMAVSCWAQDDYGVL